MENCVNIRELLEGHVGLELESVDRLYLNAYIPQLQCGGGLVGFLSRVKGKPVASLALLGQITGEFVAATKRYAQSEGVPLFTFDRHESKDNCAHRMRKERPIRDGVVFIGVAQEKAIGFSARRMPGHAIWFEFTRNKSVTPNYYYFYIDDADWGECFIKVCSYAPWSLKLYLNGHEWLKRQLAKEGIGFEALDNGFRTCENPQRLQSLAGELGPENVKAFLEKWLQRLPMPLSTAERQAGYDYRISIWQMEFSLTQIFDRPLRGRQFFEAVIQDNIDLGRPERIQLIFPRKITKQTPGKFRTRVFYQGVHPSLHVSYKHFDLKQYFKEGRGLRTEGTFYDPKDFGINKGIENLPYLKELGSKINRRLLEVERVSQNCGLSAESIQRVVLPTVTEDGLRAPGLKFGDPRVMALMLALCHFDCIIEGFRNRDLREKVAALLAVDPASYSAAKMSYDLRRLIRKGIACRVPHSHRCFLSPYGCKLVRLYARLEARVFRPALSSIHSGQAPPIPEPLRGAFRTIDQEFDRIILSAMPLRKAA